jgi:hypothetical protein
MARNCTRRKGLLQMGTVIKGDGAAPGRARLDTPAGGN